jgi:hypothetical protein
MHSRLPTDHPGVFIRRCHLQLALPCIAILMRVASTPTANASYLVIACYALLGRAQAIHALVLSWLFSMLSPGLAAEATAASVGRYAVLATAAGSVLLRSGFLVEFRVSPMVMMTGLLGLFIVGHSILFSPMVDVSVLKAVSWTTAAMTVFSAWGNLSLNQREQVSHQVFGGLILLMLVSLPLVVLPIGYLRNDTGFQGVLSHPQAFGPTMALLGAWAASQVLGSRKPSWGYVTLVSACLVLVMLSETRTAGIAKILSVVLAAVTVSVFARRRIRSLLPGLASRRINLILGIALIGALFTAPSLWAALETYLDKRSESTGLAEAYQVSRGALIDSMLENIEAHFWTGIGFGIASQPAEMIVERDPILNLPIGAAIEKGVLPIAVLEELGAFGFFAAGLWLWTVMRRAASGGVVSLAVLLCALLLNLGENLLFSPGGMGLLLLVLIGWSANARNDLQRGPVYA